MNLAIIQTVLTTLLSFALQVTTSKQAQTIINALINILPWAIKEAQDLVPSIQNIISVLQGSNELTPDQVAALAALDADADASFQAAVAAYMKNHPALLPAPAPAPANPTSGS